MANVAAGLPRAAHRRGSRPAAAAALLLAAAHLTMLLGHLAPAWTAALALALLLTCGHCALSLWRRPTRRVWWLAAAMAGGMFLLPPSMSATPGTMTAMRTTAMTTTMTTGTGSDAAPTAIPARATRPSQAVDGVGRADAGLADRAGALLGGPLTSAARWSLLVLAGSALLRCHGRRRTRSEQPVTAGATTCA